MQIKQTIFKTHTVILDFHKTRGFYNMIPSSRLLKCKCSLCSKVLERLELCSQCKSEFSTLGTESEKPVQLSFTELLDDIFVSLTYPFEGRPFTSVATPTVNDKRTPVNNVIKHECNECKLNYFIDKDKSRVNGMLLNITMTIQKDEVSEELMDKTHLLLS